MKKSKRLTFWDFCSPFYDFAQKMNSNHDKWICAVTEQIETDSDVLELAGGTAEISIRVAKKAKTVICTDLSEKMLNVARKKAKEIANIKFELANIYNLDYKDNIFDAVIASQVLHLLDNPQKAINEMLRVSRRKIILPVCLLKDIQGFAKLKVGIWKLLGFNPKFEFDEKTYMEFLKNSGLKIVSNILIDGKMPMIIVVCEK